MITRDKDFVYFRVEKLPTYVDFGKKSRVSAYVYAGDAIVDMETNIAISQISETYELFSNRMIYEKVRDMFPYKLQFDFAYYRPDKSLFHIFYKTNKYFSKFDMRCGLEIINYFDGRSKSSVNLCLYPTNSTTPIIYTNISCLYNSISHKKGALDELEYNPDMLDILEATFTNFLAKPFPADMIKDLTLPAYLDKAIENIPFDTWYCMDVLNYLRVICDVWAKKNFEHARKYLSRIVDMMRKV